MSATMTPPPAPMGGPPPGGAAPPAPQPPGGDDTGTDSDTDSNVICTITKNSDGSYTVYAGDEPEEGDSDTSEDDAAAMGAGGDQTAPDGTQTDSVGSTLKAVLDILQSDKSSEGAPGNADDQMTAGFGASKAPTAAGMGGAMAQKY